VIDNTQLIVGRGLRLDRIIARIEIVEHAQRRGQELTQLGALEAGAALTDLVLNPSATTGTPPRRSFAP
jgi:hypothetical protein